MAAPTARDLHRRLSHEQLDHCDVLDGIASHFGGVSPVRLDAVLDEIAVPLFPLAQAPLGVQGEGVSIALFDTLGLRPRHDDHRALLAHVALGFGLADPLVIAMLGHELCRRAGISSRVCVAAEGAWVGVIGDERFTLVGGTPCVADPAEIRLACAHECASLLLARMRALAPAGVGRCAAGLRRALRTGGQPEHDCPGHRCGGWGCF